MGQGGRFTDPEGTARTERWSTSTNECELVHVSEQEHQEWTEVYAVQIKKQGANGVANGGREHFSVTCTLLLKIPGEG